MKTISDIIDTKTSLGFNYFYGLEDDQGYLRRLTITNPTLEMLNDTLKDDIQFITSADGGYFRSKSQLKAFKKLKPYFLEAKKYVKKQLEKKKKGSKSEQSEILSEVNALQKELRDPFISEEEREQLEWEIRTLLKPTPDDLSEVKSMFEKIDQKVKKFLKKVGYEEENLEFDEQDEEDYYKEFEIPRESKEFDIDKLVDEDSRRYTMGEFNDLYENMGQVSEAMSAQQPANAKVAAQQTLKKDSDLQKFISTKDKAIKRHAAKPLTPQEIKNLQNFAAQTQSRMKSQMSPVEFQKYMNSGIFNLEL